MFRLAHISDPHLSPMPEVKWKELMGKRITGYINWTKARGNKYDRKKLDEIVRHLKQQEIQHLVIAGDIINLGLEAEIKNAWKWLKKIGKGKDVSVVCGNHDAYVRGSLENACEKWKEYMRGDGEKNVSFPYVRQRGEIAIIGVNSGVATAPLMAKGYFQNEQAEKLRDILEKTKDKFRVIVIHHPPVIKNFLNTKRLVGADRFQKIVKEYGAELIIHGHTHKADFQYIKQTAMVGVACASAQNAQYNLFEIERQTNKWKCNMKTFGFAKGNNNIQKISEREL